MSFWMGVAIGFFAGGALGALAMALAASAKDERR